MSMGKWWRIGIFLIATWLLLLTGCDKNTDKQEPWLVIDDQPVYETQVKLYLLQTYNDFEQHGGEDVWLIQDFSGGKSAKDVAKQRALDNLIRVKVLIAKADEMGLSISDEEKQALEDEAMAYFDSINTSFAEKNQISLEDVLQVIEENRLAMKVEETTMDNYEVSDDEIMARLMSNPDYEQLAGKDVDDLLTTYLVQHIAIYTHTRQADETFEPLADEALVKAMERLEEAYARLMDGEDFVTIARLYSEDDLTNVEEGIRLSKAQLPERFIEAINSTEIGAITPIIQGDYAYHIFKLLEVIPPDEETVTEFIDKFSDWEQALKDEARTEIIREAFGTIYGRWSKAVEVTYSTMWQDVDILSIQD